MPFRHASGMRQILFVGALALLAGCAAGGTVDPAMDSLTAQRTHPMMFARPNTMVAEMRADLADCHKHVDRATGLSGPAFEVADYFSLGTLSAVEASNLRKKGDLCMQGKGYSKGDIQ